MLFMAFGATKSGCSDVTTTTSALVHVTDHVDTVPTLKLVNLVGVIIISLLVYRVNVNVNSQVANVQ
jgi:hypothetical protein